MFYGVEKIFKLSLVSTGCNEKKVRSPFIVGQCCLLPILTIILTVVIIDGIVAINNCMRSEHQKSISTLFETLSM